MPDRTDIVYRYDGTYNGLMCCVFESFEKKERPFLLLSPRNASDCLLPARSIPTDPLKSKRVVEGIARRIGAEVLELSENAMLCCAPSVDLALLRFLRIGFRVGGSVVDRLAEPCVSDLFKALRHLWGEAHLLKGFIRFQDFDGALLAVIEPKNHVLPLLAAHFTDRFNAETFMIYDKAHHQALAYQGGRYEIVDLELLDLPCPPPPEQEIQALWRGFYQAIGIRERENPKRRMTHMPKRYWGHIIEMRQPQSAERSISSGSLSLEASPADR